MAAPAAPTNIQFDSATKQVTFESADPFDVVFVRVNQCFAPAFLEQSEPSFDIEDVIDLINAHVDNAGVDTPPNPPINTPLIEGTSFSMWINTALGGSGGPDTFVRFQYLPYGSVPDPKLHAPHAQTPDVHGNPGYINNFASAQFPQAELEERLP
jgi:hypothetical protein